MTGLRRYANRRDASEPAIVQALEAMGCSVVRMDKPVDLLVRIGSKNLLCEVKTGKGKLTKEQEAFMAAGWEVWILRDVQGATAMVNMIRRAAA
jgi:hypothetical protein